MPGPPAGFPLPALAGDRETEPGAMAGEERRPNIKAGQTASKVRIG
jgi:hypothetical protein